MKKTNLLSLLLKPESYHLTPARATAPWTSASTGRQPVWCADLEQSSSPVPGQWNCCPLQVPARRLTKALPHWLILSSPHCSLRPALWVWLDREGENSHLRQWRSCSHSARAKHLQDKTTSMEKQNKSLSQHWFTNSFCKKPSNTANSWCGN